MLHTPKDFRLSVPPSIMPAATLSVQLWILAELQAIRLQLLDVQSHSQDASPDPDNYLHNIEALERISNNLVTQIRNESIVNLLRAFGDTPPDTGGAQASHPSP
jgi:hypothetical protein